ncbi:MAG: lycopene cyclase domain-containing protein [Deltaproteobacteria bacterium]|nr:lycopene cyclase domain-containing protein [Deltaproteobacteria bacterium]
MSRADYLMHLAWALPFVALQVAVGRARLWRARRALTIVVAATAFWLSLADDVAIRLGIWTFGDEHLCGLRVDAVPLEEILFFGLTALLVAQAVVLLEPAPTSDSRSAR